MGLGFHESLGIDFVPAADLADLAVERLTSNDLAALYGSIPNGVFCSFGSRLPRVYL